MFYTFNTYIPCKNKILNKKINQIKKEYNIRKLNCMCNLLEDGLFIEGESITIEAEFRDIDRIKKDYNLP